MTVCRLASPAPGLPGRRWRGAPAPPPLLAATAGNRRRDSALLGMPDDPLLPRYR